jgi:hypothetical protein
MAALPQPSRQRHGSPGILPRTRPSGNQAPRHSLAIHAIPTSPFPRAQTQGTGDVDPSGSEETTFGSTTTRAAAASTASKPRSRRPTPQHPNRPRRPDPDEQRSAGTGVPAVQQRQRRRRRQRSGSAAQRQTLDRYYCKRQCQGLQGPARAGRRQTRSFRRNACTRQVGPPGLRRLDAVRLAAVPEQHGVYGQVDDLRSHDGSAGDDESRGLKKQPHVGCVVIAYVSHSVGTQRVTYLFFSLEILTNGARNQQGRVLGTQSDG